MFSAEEDENYHPSEVNVKLEQEENDTEPMKTEYVSRKTVFTEGNEKLKDLSFLDENAEGYDEETTEDDMYASNVDRGSSNSSMNQPWLKTEDSDGNDCDRGYTRSQVEVCEIDVDVDKLISLIREHPVIWDRTSDIYNHRNDSRAAWEEISIGLRPDIKELTDRERKEIVKLLKSKWNNIRDNWVRYHKKCNEMRKSPIKGSIIRKYLYHDQLRFMEKILDFLHEPSSNFAPSTLEIRTVPKERNQEVETRTVPRYKDLKACLEPSRKATDVPHGRKRPFKKEECESPVQSSSKCQEVPRKDPNLLFFESVIPMINDLREDETLEFRMGVLQSIYNIKARRRHGIDPPNRTQFTSFCTPPSTFCSNNFVNQQPRQSGQSPSRPPR